MSRWPAPRDDRFEEAVSIIDHQLRERGRLPLSPFAYEQLRSRSAFPHLLHTLEQLYGLNVDRPRALLARWHAWNTLRSRP